jgi:hypothetical protein
VTLLDREGKVLALLVASKVMPTMCDFIETGSAQGETADAMARVLGIEVVTIELDYANYLATVERSLGNCDILPLYGDSAEILPMILASPMVIGPVLFWLDAHEDVEGPGGSTPIEAELGAIAASPYEHVVLVDDARLFEEKESWPGMQWMVNFAKDNGWQIDVVDDIIRLTDRRIP